MRADSANDCNRFLAYETQNKGLQKSSLPSSEPISGAECRRNSAFEKQESRSVANNSETSDALSRHVNEAISSFATTELGVIAPLSAPYEAQSALNLRIPAPILRLAEHKIGHIWIGSEALKNGLEGTKADPWSAQAALGSGHGLYSCQIGNHYLLSILPFSAASAPAEAA